MLRVIENAARKDEVLRHLSELIDNSRIRATPYAVIADDPRAAIHEWSRSAAVVFIGFEAPEEGDEQSFCQRMDQWAADLPRVVLVDTCRWNRDRGHDYPGRLIQKGGLYPARHELLERALLAA